MSRRAAILACATLFALFASSFLASAQTTYTGKGTSSASDLSGPVSGGAIGPITTEPVSPPTDVNLPGISAVPEAPTWFIGALVGVAILLFRRRRIAFASNAGEADAIDPSNDAPTSRGFANSDRIISGRAIGFFAIVCILLASAILAFGNDTGWTGNGSDNKWSTGNNWDTGAPGSNNGSQMFFKGTNQLTTQNDYTDYTEFQSIVFESSAGAFTLNGNIIKLYNKIENDSSSTQTISLSQIVYDGGAGSGNQLNPVNGDIIVNSSIYLDTSGTTLNVYGDNNHVLRFNGAINNGNATGSVSLNQNSTVIYNAANTYSGDTLVNAGDLRFTVNGSASNSTIRLGGTGADSPAATLSLGTSAPADTGLSISSTLVVRPSGSGTQGTRLLRSLAPSGTNTFAGNIFLDADLTVQAATGGTLVFDAVGKSIDVKNHVLTVDANGGNGNVTIAYVLGSSSGAGGSLIKNGANTLILQNTSNNYTGTNSATLNGNGTQIGGGTLGIYGDGSLGLAPAGAYNNIQFTGSATLQDTSSNVGLNANRNISVANGATATFDSNGNTFTINGVISNASGTANIAKTGAGSVVLTNANTFSGTTTINASGGILNAAAAGALGGTSGLTVNSGGTLLLSNSGTNDRINNVATMTLIGGTFNTGGLQEHGLTNNTAGIGALTLQTSSIIDMGTGTSVVAFANSLANSAAWGTGKTLSIYNWTGTPVTGGGTDQLFFGSDLTGLSATQLAEIQFFSGAGTGSYGVGAAILANGEIVPIPEPATWAIGALALSTLLVNHRTRMIRLMRRSSPFTL